MTKDAFLTKLRDALSGLPEKEMNDTISYYSEMIDDSMEEGLAEAEAVASLGTIEEIVAQIANYTPPSKIPLDKVKPKRKLKMWEIVLLALGSPIWLSLGIAAFAVLFSLWASLWAVMISLWAIFAAVVGSGVGCVLGGIVLTTIGKVSEGLIALSVGLVCGGVGILLFFGCKWITAQSGRLTKKLLLWIKTIFTRNRGERHE